MDERLTQRKAKRARNSESEDEDNKDRLSDLHDCILLHILSLMGAKFAVQTCILSKRWKDLWIRLPALLLHLTDFNSAPFFTGFVSKILTLRDKSAPVDGLDIDHETPIKPHVIKRIVNYAVSRNVQRLGIAANFNLHGLLPDIFKCRSLTSLKLEVLPYDCRKARKLFPESLNLPALTTLELTNFTFCSSGDGNFRSDPFSVFTKLNSLTIERWELKDAQTLCISSTTLVSFTMRNLPARGSYTIELSTPSLHRLAWTGHLPHYISGSGLSSVKDVYIDAGLSTYYPESPFVLLNWLQNLVNIRLLTVTTETLQVLSSIRTLLRTNVPSLANLKRVEIKGEPLSVEQKIIMISMRDREMAASWGSERAFRSEEDAYMSYIKQFMKTPTLPDGILDFFIQNSPSAKVKIINCII